MVEMATEGTGKHSIAVGDDNVSRLVKSKSWQNGPWSSAFAEGMDENEGLLPKPKW